MLLIRLILVRGIERLIATLLEGVFSLLATGRGQLLSYFFPSVQLVEY